MEGNAHATGCVPLLEPQLDNEQGARLLVPAVLLRAGLPGHGGRYVSWARHRVDIAGPGCQDQRRREGAGPEDAPGDRGYRGCSRRCRVAGSSRPY